ncbi:MAG: M24 family metallopeptidase [Candidatus Eiseniibacteriota bacterium]
MNLPAIQEGLRERGIDAWLLYDFRHMNPIANRVAGLSADRHTTRRWFGLVPASGEPRWLHSAIEAHVFADLPGEKVAFVGWRDLETRLAWMLSGIRTVAMEYSAGNAIPYVSRVDAGTIELVRSLGVEIVSSGDLVQVFEARWGESGLASHRRAARHLAEIATLGHGWVREAVRAGKPLSEVEVQARMSAEYEARGLVTNGPPIVAVNDHAGNPHFEPTPANARPIVTGDVLLTDLWAKEKGEDAVYADITWMAFVGERVPDEVRHVWNVVSGARDAGIRYVMERAERGEPIKGADVDDATRAHVAAHGLADFFIHRTGHSIGIETHGNGANIDNLETRDERTLIADTGFSIEPGVYQPKFGVRSEIDMYLGHGRAEVTTEPQRALPALLA